MTILPSALGEPRAYVHGMGDTEQARAALDAVRAAALQARAYATYLHVMHESNQISEGLRASIERNYR